VKKPRKELTSRKWKKQRELVFRTKGHDCYVCGEWADAIDHVISAKRGGGDNIENLEPICKRCNSRKGSREYGVFLGRTPTPPVFLSNPSLVQTSVIHHSPFSTDSSQS
jgi:5-methylcytosine-specific restriction endonuclease McrA